MEISTENLEQLKSYLKLIKDFSEKEDWDEWYAQDLVMDGGSFIRRNFWR